MRKIFFLIKVLFLGIICSKAISQINQVHSSPRINASLFTSPAPVLKITRDDHVATVGLDFDEFAGWGEQLWSIGTDGLDACGYRIQWWLDVAAANVQPAENPGIHQHNHDANGNILSAINQIVTPNPVAQIQPLENNVLYHLKVEKLNGLGQICSPATETTFMGGDGARVNGLRNSMTFFDDFNLPMGATDETKWNNAMTPQTDPRFNLFFINGQSHVHTLNGTLNDAAGDKSEVAQRSRKPIVIENGLRRRVVFDMDGIFSPRSVWYLDFNPVKTDLTGHLSFFDEDGDTGLPADVLRLKASGHEISVSLINSAGASFKIGGAQLSDFGRAMAPNVRRSFDVRVGTDGVEIFVDGVSVLNTTFAVGAFKPGVYNLLWSAVGYNTSKDDNPYFLSHWDNFGFDGPDIEPFIVHNYVTHILGTDLQKANIGQNETPIFNISVPDDIRPTIPGAINEVWLVFSYLKNDFSFFDIGAGNHLLFNGISFPLPQGGNNSTPIISSLVDYSGSPISNRIKIGEVTQGGTSPLVIGNNTIQFFANNTGIVNVHLEVICPQNAPSPPYTPPAQIHPMAAHDDLPKLGSPAKIVFIDEQEFSEEADGTLLGPTVTGIIPIEILVGNGNWANWGPQLLNIPATSAEIWSSGSTPGIKNVELYLRPQGSINGMGSLIASLNTNQDAPAPQLRYIFEIDSRIVPNGNYELFLQATNNNGLKSHPAYHGIGFKFDASEWSGAYYPINITVNNPILAEYKFNGSTSNLWTNNANWDSGAIPPTEYHGPILINADCEIPSGYNLRLGAGCTLTINDQKTLKINK